MEWKVIEVLKPLLPVYFLSTREKSLAGVYNIVPLGMLYDDGNVSNHLTRKGLIFVTLTILILSYIERGQFDMENPAMPSG